MIDTLYYMKKQIEKSNNILTREYINDKLITNIKRGKVMSVRWNEKFIIKSIFNIITISFVMLSCSILCLIK